MSEAQLVEHFEAVAEHGLDYVDADERQTEQVSQVIAGVVPDLVRFRQEQRGLSARLRAELAKNPVDRARIEALRQEALGLIDRASARGGQALLSAADALTPEQRKKLTERWEKHRR
jgi:Spy/CpxP family protein refolding chaperone